MRRYGIISAMPVELETLISDCGAREKEEKGIYRLYEGEYRGHYVAMACSGVGKVNAAACTQRFIDTQDIDCVINMGIAGALGGGLRTLDTVIGSEVVYHDFFPVRVLEQRFPFTSVFGCDEGLAALAEKACQRCPEVKKYLRGRIATGDCFVEDAAAKKRILGQGSICCEMEGAAVGHVCHINGVPFLILRSISDLADEDAEMTYDEFEKKAALQSVRIVEAMMSMDSEEEK
jgi:adenosylhomocysteine nucleosidase